LLLKKANESGLALVFCLKHDFPGEWHRFVAGTADFTATVKRDHFPYFTLGTDIALSSVQLYAIQNNKLEFVTPQDLDLAALTDKLKTDGACEVSLAPNTDCATPSQHAEHFRYYHTQRADLHYDGLSGSPRCSSRPPLLPPCRIMPPR